MNENPKPIPAILPRSGWESPIAYLRAVFRAKKALDRAEEKANGKTGIPDVPPSESSP